MHPITDTVPLSGSPPIAAATPSTSPPRLQQLHALIGLGKEIWEGVDPDEYVRSLREE